MAKRILAAATGTGFTGFTAQAYTSALTTLTYMAIRGASAQLVDVLEVMLSGQDTSSVVAAFQLVRASTIDSTPAALTAPCSDGLLLPSGTALSSPTLTMVGATTGPQASAAITDAKLELGMNSFGGIVRWNAAPTQQWQIVGTAAPGIESVLFNSSASGGSTAKASAHIIYEPY